MADQQAYGRERYRGLELPHNAKAEFWLERRGERVETGHSFKSAQTSGGGGGGGWVRCTTHGCLGEALVPGEPCINHASVEGRRAFLSQVERAGLPLNLRGITLSQALWDEIKRSPLLASGFQVPISLVAAEINAAIQVDGARHQHMIDLTGAAVFSHIELRNCQFYAPVLARHAFFNGGALNCSGSTFFQDVDVSYSQTERVSLGMDKCTFKGSITLDGMIGAIHLSSSSIAGNLSCKYNKAHVIANDLVVDGAVDFAYTDGPGLHGERLHAKSATRIGPCKMQGLHLRQATFDSRISVEVEASHIDLTSASFEEGGLLRVVGAQIQLEQLSLGGPLRLAGPPNGPMPAVIGLSNSDAGKMAFSNVDLTKCSFHGAHGLGDIVIESTTAFSRRPWWAGGRRFIADEYAWRFGAGKLRRLGWKFNGMHVGDDRPSPQRGQGPITWLRPQSAQDVAALYRELRRSLEAKSDMPGAGDFYYGEMEMRRLGGCKSTIEVVLVWLYWMFAGYGLRPGRAVITWVVIVVVGTLGLLQAGFVEPPTSIDRAMLTAVRAAIPGVPTAEKLSTWGLIVETGLRVLGTVSIALFVLSARSLVMRKPNE